MYSFDIFWKDHQVRTSFSFNLFPFIFFFHIYLKFSLATSQIRPTGGEGCRFCCTSSGSAVLCRVKPAEPHDISVHTGQLCQFSAPFSLAFCAASVPCSLVGGDGDYSGSGKIWASLIIAHCLYCHSATK